MFREDVGQQIWHPSFDGIRVAVDQGANSKDRRMKLANSCTIDRRLAVRRELAIFDQSDEPILYASQYGEQGQAERRIPTRNAMTLLRGERRKMPESVLEHDNEFPVKPVAG